MGKNDEIHDLCPLGQRGQSVPSEMRLKINNKVTCAQILPSLATQDERLLIKTLPICMTTFNVFTEKVQCLSRALDRF